MKDRKKERVKEREREKEEKREDGNASEIGPVSPSPRDA